MEKKRNYARLYCLLGEVMPQLDRDEAKCLLADLVSDGRTTSLRELTEEEFERAVEFLSSQLKGASAEVKKARSQALHQIQKYGVDTTSWDAVNAFTQQPRIAGKAFFYLNKAELEALTRKMRAINAKSEGDKKKLATVQTKQTTNQERTLLSSMTLEEWKRLFSRKTRLLN